MMYENEERVEQVVLICVDIGDYDAERSLDELQELAASAGAQVVSRVIQKKIPTIRRLYWVPDVFRKWLNLCRHMKLMQLSLIMSFLLHSRRM